MIIVDTILPYIVCYNSYHFRMRDNDFFVIDTTGGDISLNGIRTPEVTSFTMFFVFLNVCF